MNEQYHLYGTAFKRFVQEYRGALRNSSGLLGLLGGNRRKALDGLRKRYLQLTESNDLTLLDAGRVHPRDFAEFATWAETLAKGQGAANAEIEPLKILITHHPLVAEPDAQYAVKGSERKGTFFEQLARSAGKAGFHLALHGHIHKPQVLADLSLLQDCHSCRMRMLAIRCGRLARAASATMEHSTRSRPRIAASATNAIGGSRSAPST